MNKVFLGDEFSPLGTNKKGAATCPNDFFGKKHKVAIYQGNKLELTIFKSWYIVGFEKNSTFYLTSSQIWLSPCVWMIIGLPTSQN